MVAASFVNGFTLGFNECDADLIRVSVKNIHSLCLTMECWR